jgi:hypothetical protein
MDKVMEILPEGGNLNLCLTCGTCSSGRPATGLEDMDPRRFLRMAALDLDDEIFKSDWVWRNPFVDRYLSGFRHSRRNEREYLLPEHKGLTLLVFRHLWLFSDNML